MPNINLSIKGKWVYWFLLLDILFVLDTILIRYIPSEANIIGYGTVRLILQQMDLGVEMTVGSWWSALHIFLSSLLSYEIFSRQESKNKFAWLFFSVVFLGLSADEVGSIHERIFGNWVVIIGIFLVGIIPFIYAIWQLLRTSESRNSAVLILVGFGIMTSAAPVEYLQHNLSWPPGLVGLRIAFEEGIEIFGALMCLVAVAQQRFELPWQNTWSRIIPNPFLMRFLNSILVSGFVIHVLISILTSLYWEVGSWGSPSVFFPTFIFIIVGASCFWFSNHGNISNPKVWRIKSYVLFVISLFSFYLVLPETTFQYFLLLGEISTNEKIATLWFAYFSVSSYLLYEKVDIETTSKLLLISLTVMILVVSYAIGHQMAYSISAGIVSLLIALVVLDECYLIGFDDNLNHYRQETMSINGSSSSILFSLSV